MSYTGFSHTREKNLVCQVEEAFKTSPSVGISASEKLVEDNLWSIPFNFFCSSSRIVDRLSCVFEAW